MPYGCIDARGCVSAFADVGSTTATSLGTKLTASGSINTKGSYTQLTASTTRDTDYLIVCADTSQGSGFLSVDIAVGGAGSEQIILADLINNPSTAQLTSNQYFIPFSIPAGTRIAGRCQSTISADVADVSIICGSGCFNFQPYSSCTTYGFNSGTTIGTAIDPGGTANTKGSYTQITASTTRDHTGLMWLLDVDGDSTSISQEILFDIAVGAAASEQVILPNLRCVSSSAAAGITFTSIGGGVVPIQIPSGTRLSARMQSTNNVSTSRKFGIVLYGLS